MCSEPDPAVGTRSLSPPLWVNPTLFFYALGYFGHAARTAALTDEILYQSTAALVALKDYTALTGTAALLPAFSYVFNYSFISRKLVFCTGFEPYPYKWCFKSFVRELFGRETHPLCSWSLLWLLGSGRSAGSLEGEKWQTLLLLMGKERTLKLSSLWR